MVLWKPHSLNHMRLGERHKASLAEGLVQPEAASDRMHGPLTSRRKMAEGEQHTANSEKCSAAGQLHQFSSVARLEKWQEMAFFRGSSTTRAEVKAGRWWQLAETTEGPRFLLLLGPSTIVTMQGGLEGGGIGGRVRGSCKAATVINVGGCQMSTF